ncbi:MAG: translation initiation factor IF-2 [Flavobacteriales bacterium]|tara:strand:+ start:5457 stop:8261 length:2805 start_codon:yes stop_codon:yes gene_type:complete
MAVKRLSKIAKELNVGISSLVDHLKSKGVDIESSPNTKVEENNYSILLEEFADAKLEKAKAKEVVASREKKPAVVVETPKKEEVVIKAKPAEMKRPEVIGTVDLNPKPKKVAPVKPVAKEVVKKVEVKKEEPKKVIKKKVEPETIKASIDKLVKPEILGKIDLNPPKKAKIVEAKKEAPKKEEEKVIIAKKEVVKPVEKKAEAPIKEVVKEITEIKEVKEEKDKTIVAKAAKLTGTTVLGKIELPVEKEREPKGKRKRIKKVNIAKTINKRPVAAGGEERRKGTGARGPKPKKAEITPESIQKEIKETLARLSSKGGGKKKGDKYRRDKRAAIAEKRDEDILKKDEESKTLQLTEFVTVSDLASLMDVTPTDVISACMSLGIFASINQRIDAETITIIADEFGFGVDFISAEDQIGVEEEEIIDAEEDLIPRAPIVTVMGHVDHGKTSLLDYIREAKIASGEAGGITQHIGAYKVTGKDSGRQITFLDTPGHEAFTAMRARGAAVTDIAIIIISADDAIMPQTKEAINHCQAAGVPMVFAINKIDKEGANPDNVKTQLSAMNLLVEEWGGKYQSQEISAKTGVGIEDLLEKVLLEAELLELKANPDRMAQGTVLESSLDKGRGYVTNILVEKGTLRVGDMMLTGPYYGKVKAMHNEDGKKIKEVGPATPVSIIGLNGAPNAGDKFNILQDEKEAKLIASKREQLQREQGVRTKKVLTLEEIGRRLAIGNFKELNIIIKGDVDGSIEALTDSLLKLSTEEIAVNVIHKAVGAITEADVNLAVASDAIIIGFQVRPTGQARKLAEAEEVDIRLYSIIYKAIEEIKDAMEGMLSPDIIEEVLGTAEIREVFKISKIGTIAGSYVLEGNIVRTANVRLIRDGIVIYNGKLATLKRFKDDVKEVKFGYECGIALEKFNDLQIGDVFESYHEVEVAKKLK